MRERQIPVMHPSLASGLRKLKSDGTGQCLYLARYCSQATRKFARFILPAWDGRRCLPRSTKGCLFTSTFVFIARESQRLQWSHLAKSLGQAANFELQPATTTTSTTTQPRFLCCKYLCVGALFWISLQYNLVTVLVLGSCGTLALSCAPYIFYLLALFTHSELLVQLILSSKTMAQSVQGS